MLVVEPKRWATSEEVVGVLEKLLEQAKSGEIVSLAYVAERRDTHIQSAHTKVENIFQCAGIMMSMAIRLLGFEDTRTRMPLEGH